MDVDRVACFHDAVHGYSSLLYELRQESGFEDFMCCLKKLWRALDSDENLPKKLVSSAGAGPLCILLCFCLPRVAGRLTAQGKSHLCGDITAALVIGRKMSYVFVAEIHCSNCNWYSMDFSRALPRLSSVTWCSFALARV